MDTIDYNKDKFLELLGDEKLETSEELSKTSNEKSVTSDELSETSNKLEQYSLHVTSHSSLVPGSVIISVSPKYFRHTKVACPYGNLLIGNPAKAKACPDAFNRGKTWVGSEDWFERISKDYGGK